MPARTYHFSSQNQTRDGKHKKAIPDSQWKGVGYYYLRGGGKGTEGRYWAKRSFSKDVNRKGPQGKRDAYGTGAYSQYHDVGKGRYKTAGLTKARKDKKVVSSIKRKGYPATAHGDMSKARKLRAITGKSKKQRKATAKRQATKKKAPVKRKSTKRKTTKRKAISRR
jgi:hypothetical protein